MNNFQCVCFNVFFLAVEDVYLLLFIVFGNVINTYNRWCEIWVNYKVSSRQRPMTCDWSPVCLPCPLLPPPHSPAEGTPSFLFVKISVKSQTGLCLNHIGTRCKAFRNANSWSNGKSSYFWVRILHEKWMASKLKGTSFCCLCIGLRHLR